MTRIEPLDHRDASAAQAIHALLLLAHAQEAALLRPSDAVAMPHTAAQLQASEAFYLGAFRADRLVGALSLGADDEPGQMLVSSLFVHPDHQRRGVGRSLLVEAIRRANGTMLAVATPGDNLPALGLYQGLGFVAYRWGSIGTDAVALVKLHHRGPPAGAPATLEERS